MYFKRWAKLFAYLFVLYRNIDIILPPPIYNLYITLAQGGDTLKKSYSIPMAEINTFVAQDIITASSGYTQGGFEGWAPDSDDSEFGS